MRRRPFWPAVYFRACVLALCAATMTAAGADLKAVPRVHPERWPKLHPPLARDPLLEARVEQLLARLTPAQRVGQLIQADIGSITPDDLRHYPLGSILNGGNSSPRGDKLAAPGEWLTLADRFYQASMSASPAGLPLLWGTDAVHGHNNIPGATIFPHNIGLGAARDPQLVRRIGQITALEVRVTGLDWAFSPTVAVARDARWGRTYESYSENPGLVREYAAAMVEGLQGVTGTPQFLDAAHVLATPKHFLGDGATEGGHDEGDSAASESELRAIDAAGYEAALAAGAQTVMVSFSSWRGAKMHGNRALLTEVLKERMAVPVAEQQTVETHAPLEDLAEERPVAMHLHAMPAGVGHHHRLRGRGDRRLVARRIDIAQLALARLVVPLVPAARGPAIAQEVLRRRQHVRPIEELRRTRNPLQALDHRRGVFPHQGRVFRVALVSASPARVAGHRHGRGERPVEPGDPHLEGSDLADAADELRIVRRSEPDVVGEERGTGNVVVAVDCVRAPQQRQGNRGGGDRGVIEPVCEPQPLTRCRELVVAGRGVAAVEDGTEGIVPQIIRSDAADISLDKLTYLLRRRQAGEQSLHAGLELRIGRQGRVQLRPALRMDGGRFLGVRIRRRYVGGAYREGAGHAIGGQPSRSTPHGAPRIHSRG